MKHTFMAAVAVAALALGGCANGKLTPQAVVALQVACQVDGSVQPIAAGVVSGLGATGATVATADTALVHPAIVAACAKLGGTQIVAQAGTVGSTTGVVPVASGTAKP